MGYVCFTSFYVKSALELVVLFVISVYVDQKFSNGVPPIFNNII